MAKNIGPIVDRYSKDLPGDPREQLRGVSIKIDLQYMIMLEALAEHIGKKKTPLMGEIAEAAVQEVYDGLRDEMDKQLVDYTERKISEDVIHV